MQGKLEVIRKGEQQRRQRIRGLPVIPISVPRNEKQLSRMQNKAVYPTPQSEDEQERLIKGRREWESKILWNGRELDSQGREYVVNALSRARMLVTESSQVRHSLPTKLLISLCM
jgi:hypothetical protein